MACTAGVCGTFPASVQAIQDCDSGNASQCQTAYTNNWNRTCKQIHDTYGGAGQALPTGSHAYRVTYTYH